MTGNKVNNIVEEVKNRPVVVGDTPAISYKEENKSECPKTTQYRDWLFTTFILKEDDIRKILTIVGAVKYAYICHDKDKYSEDDVERLEGKNGKGEEVHVGDLKDKHFHVYFHSKCKYSVKAMIKFLGNFGIFSHEIDHVKCTNLTLRYLIHVDNPEKASYSVNAVSTNIKEYKNIVSSILSEVEDGQDEIEVIKYIQDNSNVCVSFTALVTQLYLFRPELVKVALRYSYALKTYIEQTYTQAYITSLEAQIQALNAEIDEYREDITDTLKKRG